jgi:sugar phosphate isomerase/epimerase
MFKNLSIGMLGHKATYEETAALAAEHGFEGIDADLGYAREKSVSAVKELLSKYNLKLGGFGLGVRWRPKDSDREYADSLEQLVRDARMASELGVTRCATWVMPCDDLLSFHQHFALFVRRMRSVAEILDSFDIRLGLEFIGPLTLRASKKHFFVHTMDGMRAVCAAIGVGNCGFLLDSFHWYTSGGQVSDIEHLDSTEVVTVHANDAKVGRTAAEQIDNQRELPGTGVIDLKGFFGALRKIGYDGPVTVEPFNQALKEMSREDAIKATAAALKKTMG